MNFTLGSDPELMLVDLTTNRLVSAIPHVNGTKAAPLPLDRGMAIHDNVNLEFGIEPAKNEDEWVDTTRHILKQLKKILPEHLKMAVIASADFPASELEHPEAREFACDPDFDPYEFDINEIPDGAADGTLRSCGGHVHIGIDEVAGDIDKQAELAKAMDVFLGLPSLILDKDPTSHRRRKLYGNAGAHRPKPYGVEYRALGNFWLSHPKLTRLVYLLTRDGLEAYLAGHLDAIQWGLVRKTINQNLVDKAEYAIKGLVIPLLKQDTRDLLAECLKLPHSDIHESWDL